MPWLSAIRRFFTALSPADSRFAPRTGAYSHPGLVLDENEDSYLVVRLPGAPIVFTAIADGLGGLEAGEIASAMALEKLFQRHMRELANAGAVTPLAARRFLKKAFLEANAALVHVNREMAGRTMMGTTLVAGVFARSWAIVSHVGDSRCYRLRNGRIEQLTRDHTLVELMVTKGNISREAALTHPLSHVLSHCLGTQMRLPFAVSTHSCRPGDRFLLCSDGLSNFISGEKIVEALTRAPSPQAAARTLVGRSLAAGSVDNVTSVTVFY